MFIAVDPGTEESAYVIFNDDGRILKFEKAANGRVLEMVRAAEGPMVYEMVASYGMPVGREVFQTVVWIGRFVEACPTPCYEMYRREVKLHLCKSPKANDASIRQALIDRFGPGKEKAVGTKRAQGPLYGIKADVWAALALGLTWFDTKRAAR